MAESLSSALVPAGMLYLLPKGKHPQPSALRPKRSVQARLASPAERRAGKAKLFLASSVDDLVAMGFNCIYRAPSADADAGMHDVCVESFDGSCASRVLVQHDAFSKATKAERNRVRETCVMLSTVRFALACALVERTLTPPIAMTAPLPCARSATRSNAPIGCRTAQCTAEGSAWTSAARSAATPPRSCWIASGRRYAWPSAPPTSIPCCMVIRVTR